MKSLMHKLKGQDMSAEKKKDYRNVVILQFMIIGSALLLEDILKMSGLNEKLSFMLRDCFFLTLGGIYLFYLWDLLRDFSENKFLIYALLLLIMGTFAYALVAVNPLYKFLPSNWQRPSLFYIHLVIFISESIVIYHCIMDLFAGEKMSQEKLWGCTCIFLMIGISFGSVYDLICIINPGALGIDNQLGLESYTDCIFYSMSILGQNPAFPEAIPLVRNIGLLESVWSNLFVVILVGRLLGQPD